MYFQKSSAYIQYSLTVLPKGINVRILYCFAELLCCEKLSLGWGHVNTFLIDERLVHLYRVCKRVLRKLPPALTSLTSNQWLKWFSLVCYLHLGEQDSCKLEHSAVCIDGGRERDGSDIYGQKTEIFNRLCESIRVPEKPQLAGMLTNDRLNGRLIATM